MLTAAEVATLLGLSARTVYALGLPLQLNRAARRRLELQVRRPQLSEETMTEEQRFNEWFERYSHEQRELPEPAAWRVYFPDEQREEFASSLDDLLDDLTNCAHDDPEPLYTADQMREAGAEERA